MSDSATFKVIVANVPPAVTSPADQTADEGTSKTFDLGSFTDPGADSPWRVTVDWGDGSADSVFTEASPGAIADQAHTYADGPNTYTVSITVEEDNGAGVSGSGSFKVTVANVPPEVTLVGPPSANEGETKSYTFSFIDPGADSWSGVVSCGANGTASNSTLHACDEERLVRLHVHRRTELDGVRHRDGRRRRRRFGCEDRHRKQPPAEPDHHRSVVRSDLPGRQRNRGLQGLLHGSRLRRLAHVHC